MREAETIRSHARPWFKQDEAADVRAMHHSLQRVPKLIAAITPYVRRMLKCSSSPLS